MTSIHPSMLETVSKELDTLRVAQTVLSNIRSSKGWGDSQSITGSIGNPSDTILITIDISDALTRNERDTIIGILANGQARVVDRLTSRLESDYGITIG